MALNFILLVSEWEKKSKDSEQETQEKLSTHSNIRIMQQ